MIDILSFSKDSMPADAKSPSDWKSVPLPNATPGRRRNVARLRAMGGDPTYVPPDFNRSMLAIGEELWHSMPRSGRVSVLVNSLLIVTRNVVELNGSNHETPLRAQQPCCQFHTHRPRIGC